MIKSTIFASAKNWPLRAFVQKLAPTVGGRQRGISLIEGILYLVLALSVVIGGIALFQNAQLSNRVTEGARGVVAISSETRALHQNARDFGTADLTAALVGAGAVPSNFQDNAGTGIRHPWGGAVTVTGADQQFTIELEDVPSDACIRILPVDLRGQGVAGIGIASVVVDTVDADANTDGEVTVVEASDVCGNQTTVDITFTYDR